MIIDQEMAIKKIEGNYLKDEAKNKKTVLVDISPVLDTDALPAEAPLSTPALGPSSISSTTPFMTPSSSTAPLPPRSSTGTATAAA
ncbi:hypothetical protein H5410_046372 [Solanum commersonii]|uniref:Uncharacterized protein n=1 Tax=Solanum commersonii TaxID=4109 RepID=A0A9J5XE16_SOLCO|nr:hypothetical protein H5410_046372 [Solanum commersonii]